MNISAKLTRLGACAEAVIWAKAYGPDEQKAWSECKRGDWMLWVIGRTINCEPWSDGRKPLVACAMACALTVKGHWPKGDRGIIAKNVSVILSWTRGKSAVEQAQEATRQLAATAAATDPAGAYVAYDAAGAYVAATYDATDAACDAAYVAYDAAYVAYDAAYVAATYDATAAASVAYDAAYVAACAADADADATRIKTLAKCADIVRMRKHYPDPPEA